MTPRDVLAAEAYSWIGTPYALRGHIKGESGAIDCASFIAECLINCRLARREDLGVYSDDWFLHATGERYLMAVMRHARKTLETIAYQSTRVEPGCILLTRCAQSKRWNHGAIAIGKNKAVHAVQPKVQEFNIGLHPMWAYHEISIFDPFLK